MTSAPPGGPRATTSLRPTRALVGSLVAAGVLHLLVRVTGGGWLALGSAAALVLPVVALVLRPRLDLEVALQVPRVTAGGSVEVQVHVRAHRRSAPCRLSWPDGLLGSATVAVPALEAGGRTRGAVVVAVPVRGTAEQVEVELASTWPFGMLRAVRRLTVPCRVVVHPVVGTAPVLPGSGSGATRSTPVAGTGTEVLGLRPWRTGDAATALHARSTARHGRPVVLEREREQGPRRVVLAGAAGSGEAWEQAVSRTAGLCLQVLASGGEPVLVGAAPSLRPSREAVLDWLSGLEAAGPARQADVARAVREAGRGGTVLVLGSLPPGLSGVQVVRP